MRFKRCGINSELRSNRLSNVAWWKTSEDFSEDVVASCADLLETEIQCRTCRAAAKR